MVNDKAKNMIEIFSKPELCFYITFTKTNE